jgi:hypothetical protein
VRYLSVADPQKPLRYRLRQLAAQHVSHGYQRLHIFLQLSGIPNIPKVFQFMRSSHENEMAEEYPLKCVVDWVGHDLRVVAKHYLDSSNDKHHQKAISEGEKVARNPTRAMPVLDGNGPQTENRQKNKEVASTYSTVPCGVIPDSAILATPKKWAMRDSK